MKTVRIEHVEIPYVIKKKNNKHTYFYFRKDGCIHIHLSKHQREKDAIRYINEHQEVFLKKYYTVQKKSQNRPEHMLWGHPYKIVVSRDDSNYYDNTSNTFYRSKDDADHFRYKSTFEQQEMMKYLDILHQKYYDNKLVSLDDVMYRTNYTTSRHGSCHSAKKVIRISTFLVRLDPIFTEYVYCHEIAHLKVPNHSQSFYEVLEQLFPDYKHIRKQLKEVW